MNFFAVSLVKRLLSHFIILPERFSAKIHRLLKFPLRAGVVHVSLSIYLFTRSQRSRRLNYVNKKISTGTKTSEFSACSVKMIILRKNSAQFFL